MESELEFVMGMGRVRGTAEIRVPGIMAVMVVKVGAGIVVQVVFGVGIRDLNTQ